MESKANIINLYSFKLLFVRYKVGKRIVVFKMIRFQAKDRQTMEYLTTHEACTIIGTRAMHESSSVVVYD